MHKIILWYNINRKLIWVIIGITVIAIILVKAIEYIWTQNKKQEQDEMIGYGNNTEVELNSITLDEDKSTISGESMSKAQTNVLTRIDEFINYCNNSQVDEAYNLLSEDCKNEMYPTVDEFKQNYYNKIFEGKKKNISVENWIGYIYKVKYMEDALSTGIYNTENTIQDYITIVWDENDEIKLNINNYIGKQDINKEKNNENIDIKVLEKHQYMDYETYTFEITNNSDNTILLNSSNNTDTMYLEDKNEIQYFAYTHELSEAELKLASKETKKIKIKYYNKYSSTRKIENIVFSKIILNYYAYVNYQNVGYYRDYGVIQIDI